MINLKTEIATILRKNGRTECVKKAEMLKNTSDEMNKKFWVKFR